MGGAAQQLVEFRENLYQTFPFRSDATMDLIDAIRAIAQLNHQLS